MTTFPAGKATDRNAGYLEVLIAAAALAAIIAGGLFAAHGSVLFTSPLWLDEHHTLLLTTHGPWTNIFSELTQGADFNPPTLFLLERVFAAIVGRVDNTSLRVLALASTWLTMVTVYMILRRDFRRAPAFAGALALWAHPFFVYHGFEARFYGPLLFFSAAFILCASRSYDDDLSLAAKIATGVTAVLLCTIHYFGLFVWTIVVVTIAVRAWPHTRTRLSRTLPALAGPLALLACVPIYLGQRSSVSVTTWVPKLSAVQVKNMLDALFVTRTLVLVLLIAIGIAILARSQRAPSPSERDDASPGVAALLALAALPLIIFVFSYLVQPSLLPRYAVPAMLVWTPVIAWSVQRVTRPAQGALILLLAAGSVTTIQGTAAVGRAAVTDLSADSAAVAPLLKAGKLVVMPSRHILYKLATKLPAQSRMVFFDFDNTQVLELFGPNVFRFRRTNEFVIERDVGRIHHRLYGFPTLISTRELDSIPEFYVYLPAVIATNAVTRLMPERQVTKLTPRLLRLTRK